MSPMSSGRPRGRARPSFASQRLVCVVLTCIGSLTAASVTRSSRIRWCSGTSSRGSSRAGPTTGDGSPSTPRSRAACVSHVWRAIETSAFRFALRGTAPMTAVCVSSWPGQRRCCTRYPTPSATQTRRCWNRSEWRCTPTTWGNPRQVRLLPSSDAGLLGFAWCSWLEPQVPVRSSPSSLWRTDARPLQRWALTSSSTLTLTMSTSRWRRRRAVGAWMSPSRRPGPMLASGSPSRPRDRGARHSGRDPGA